MVLSLIRFFNKNIIVSYKQNDSKLTLIIYAIAFNIWTFI